MIERVRKLSSSEKGPWDGAWFLKDHGMSMDLGFYEKVDGCAEGGPCKETLMLCGTCMHSSQVNNIVYGVMSELLGVWDFIRDEGANWADPEHDEGQVQHSSYELGEAFAKAAAKTVSGMCKAANTFDLFWASENGNFSCCTSCAQASPAPSPDWSTQEWD
jgi:hypothetical protein